MQTTLGVRFARTRDRNGRCRLVSRGGHGRRVDPVRRHLPLALGDDAIDLLVLLTSGIYRRRGVMPPSYPKLGLIRVYRYFPYARLYSWYHRRVGNDPFHLVKHQLNKYNVGRMKG